MNKSRIVKNNYEFQHIIKNNRPYKYKGYVLYIERQNIENYQFGFSVGKKIGNAVIRNRIKRQLRSIVRKMNFNNGFKCIIISTNNILNMKYEEIQDSLEKAFLNLNLLKGEKYEKK